MKKVVIMMALLLFQTQITVSAATNSATVKKPVQGKTTQVKQTTQTQPKTNVTKNDEYLLKYNINDLEAAPWLNGGKRKL